MENPFHAPNIAILREAFPSVEVRVIDEALWSAKGDVNHAFEILLAMSNSNRNCLSPPPLPNRRSNNSEAAYTTTFPGVNTRNARMIPIETNPFLIGGNAEPLTVREELAKWRQDLQKESRQRATNARNKASTLNLSQSNIFKSNTSRSSSQDRHPEQGNVIYRQEHGLQRPLIPTFRTTSSVFGIHHCASTPNVSYQPHSRSNSNPVIASPPLRFPNITVTVPALPERRRQSSNSTSSTNPFVARRPLPVLPTSETIPPTNPNHREPIIENDVSAFNPFEEAEMPPPAYSDIQKDIVVDLAP